MAPLRFGRLSGNERPPKPGVREWWIILHEASQARFQAGSADKGKKDVAGSVLSRSVNQAVIFFVPSETKESRRGWQQH